MKNNSNDPQNPSQSVKNQYNCCLENLFTINDPDHRINQLKGIDVTDDLRSNIKKSGSISTYLKAKSLHKDDIVNILTENGFQISIYDEIMFNVKNDKQLDVYGSSLIKLRYLLPIICGSIVVIDKSLTEMDKNCACLCVFYFGNEWSEFDFQQWLLSCHKCCDGSLVGTLKLKKHSVCNLMDRLFPKVHYNVCKGCLTIDLKTWGDTPHISPSSI